MLPTQLSYQFKTKKNQNKLEKGKKMRMTNLPNSIKELKNLMKSFCKSQKLLYFYE